MSMNLHCKEVDLQQTPTYITYICYYSYKKDKENSNVAVQVKDNWISIREKYILWLKMRFQDHYNYWPSNWSSLSEEERQDIHTQKEDDRKYMHDQIDLLRSFNKLTFYIM